MKHKRLFAWFFSVMMVITAGAAAVSLNVSVPALAGELFSTEDSTEILEPQTDDSTEGSLGEAEYTSEENISAADVYEETDLVSQESANEIYDDGIEAEVPSEEDDWFSFDTDTSDMGTIGFEAEYNEESADALRLLEQSIEDKTESGMSIVVSGMMPENATVKITPLELSEQQRRVIMGGGY